LPELVVLLRLLCAFRPPGIPPVRVYRKLKPYTASLKTQISLYFYRVKGYRVRVRVRVRVIGFGL